jgi:hypothetical protein
MKLKDIFRKLRYGRLYIVADSPDNSISLSDGFIAYIRKDLGPIGKVAARVVQDEKGGYYIHFSADEGEDGTYRSVLCRNDYYDSIGFECLVPTVNRIFYDYKIAGEHAQMDVSVVKIKGRKLYKIDKKV